MGLAPKGFVLVQLTVLVVSCLTVFGEEHTALPPIPPPAETPSHHHHHHHPPAHPPAHPPSHPPAHPPTHHHHHHHNGHPPTKAPAHPPSHHHHHGHPPIPSPVHPPSHTPTHQPPSHTPVHPPSHPPHDHAPSHTPVHPPVHPPAYPPVYHPPRSPPFPRSFVAIQGVVYCKSCKYAGVDTLLGASPVLGATVKLQCNNTKYPLVQTVKTDKNGYFFITAPKTITSYGAHKCKVFVVSSPLASCQMPSDFHDGLKGSLLKPEKTFVSEKHPFVLYTVGPFAFEPKCPR